MSEPHDPPRVTPPDGSDDEAVREYGRQLAMDGLLDTLLRESEERDQPVGRASSVRLRRRSAVMASIRQETHSAAWRRAVSVAAVVLLGVGVVWLWRDGTAPVEQPAARDQLRRETLLREVKDLDQALSVVQEEAASEEEDRRSPEAKAPSPEQELATAHREEAEEAERFIRARRDFVLSQLRRYEPTRPRIDLSDDRESVEPEPPELPAVPVLNDAPAAVGHVVASDVGERKGALVRSTDGVQQRLPLKKGVVLKAGDRIETTAEADELCASVSLDGGATLDLSRNTVIELMGRDALRLQTGRIYAKIKVPSESSDRSSAAPFALQTRAGRFLAQDVRAEIFCTPLSSKSKGGARIDHGKVHLVSRKGHVVGSKGQEIRARADGKPTKQEGFSAPIWRGRPRAFTKLPFGPESRVIFSCPSTARAISSHYVLAMAHRGEIRLAAIQTSHGGTNQEQSYLQLTRDAQALQQTGIRNIPPLTMGTPRPLTPAASGNFVDTQPAQTPAALQILAAAREATNKKPVLFVCGGAATDLASAWLLDRSIADRIVFVGQWGVKRGLWWKGDPWAARIVLHHFRCVLAPGTVLSIGENRLHRITDPRWATLMRNETRIDADFRMLCLISVRNANRKVNRVRFTGFQNGRPTFKGAPQGRIWRIKDQAEKAMQEEFDRVFLSPPVR